MIGYFVMSLPANGSVRFPDSTTSLKLGWWYVQKPFHCHLVVGTLVGSLRQVVVQSWSLVASDRPGERLRRRGKVPLESDSASAAAVRKRTLPRREDVNRVVEVAKVQI